MIRMVNVMLCAFYHNKEMREKKYMVGVCLSVTKLEVVLFGRETRWFLPCHDRSLIKPQTGLICGWINLPSECEDRAVLTLLSPPFYIILQSL